MSDNQDPARKEQSLRLRQSIVNVALIWKNSLANSIGKGELTWEELEPTERSLFRRVEEYQVWKGSLG